MNKGILLITGPTQSEKSWLARCIEVARPNFTQVWDEPILKGKGSCRLAIKQFAKHGVAIITMTNPTAPFPIKIDKTITCWS